MIRIGLSDGFRPDADRETVLQREIRRVRSAAVFVCAENHGTGTGHADKSGPAFPERLREQLMGNEMLRRFLAEANRRLKG